MAEPLTDEQLAEIRKRAAPEPVDSDTALGGPQPTPLDHYNADVPLLLDEVERLKADLVLHKAFSNTARLEELEDEFAVLWARNKELEDADHLRQSRMGEAVEFWRMSTGRDDVTPPLGDLLAWLMKELQGRRSLVCDGCNENITLRESRQLCPKCDEEQRGCMTDE